LYFDPDTLEPEKNLVHSVANSAYAIRELQGALIVFLRFGRE